MLHEHYTHTAPDIPSSTALSIFFFLLHFLLMQLLFLLLVLFRGFLHNLLCFRPILHTGQFDQQITHDHSIMGTANDKPYDATHDASSLLRCFTGFIPVKSVRYFFDLTVAIGFSQRLSDQTGPDGVDSDNPVGTLRHKAASYKASYSVPGLSF